MDIKLVAMDMDGTLLDENMELSTRNATALRRLKDAGITPCLSSGRPPRGLKKFRDQLGFELPLITFNGAEVLIPPSEKPIYANELNHHVAEEAFKLGVEKGAHVVIWQSDELIMCADTQPLREYQSMSNAPYLFYSDDIDLSALSLRKVLWKHENPTFIANWREEMGKHFKGRLNVATSSENLLEFVSVDVPKGVALKRLCDNLGIDISQTAVFGDGYNDLPMLEVAGVSIAMANACDEVKSRCDKVTLSNTQNGVADYIEKYILK